MRQNNMPHALECEGTHCWHASSTTTMLQTAAQSASTAHPMPLCNWVLRSASGTCCSS